MYYIKKTFNKISIPYSNFYFSGGNYYLMHLNLIGKKYYKKTISFPIIFLFKQHFFQKNRKFKRIQIDEKKKIVEIFFNDLKKVTIDMNYIYTNVKKKNKSKCCILRFSGNFMKNFKVENFLQIFYFKMPISVYIIKNSLVILLKFFLVSLKKNLKFLLFNFLKKFELQKNPKVFFY
jgi:hypothetical protein